MAVWTISQIFFCFSLCTMMAKSHDDLLFNELLDLHESHTTLYTYHIYAKTHQNPHSETVDDVYVTLIGANGNCDATLTTNNERNSIKKTEINCQHYLGEIEYLNVTLEAQDAWYMDEITIHYIYSEYVELFPGPFIFDAGDNAARNSLPFRSLEPFKGFDYTILAETGNIRNSHTDDPIYITLIGSKGKCEEQVLTTNSDQNSIKTTNIRCSEYLGDVKTARIRIEGEDGWYLETLMVYFPHTEQVFVFPCQCWLDDGVDASRLSEVQRDIQAITDFPYDITAWTAEIEHAETNDAIFIDIIGSHGSCNGYELTTNSDRNGMKKTSIHCSTYIGEVQSVVLHLDEQGSDGWNMNRMRIRDEYNNMDFDIECACWFDAGVNPHPDSLPRRSLIPYNVYPFIIEAATGDITYAQSNADFDISLFPRGHEIICGVYELEKNTVRNGVQISELECPGPIEAIESIQIRIDGSDGWFVKHISVKDIQHNITYFHEVGAWIDDGKDPAANSRPIITLTNLEVYTYEIVAKTGSVTNAESNGIIFIDLIGSHSSCRQKALTPNIQNDGEQITRLDCPHELGELQNIFIRIDSDDGWFMEYMKIRDVNKKRSYIVECSCWFDDGNGADLDHSVVTATLTPVEEYGYAVITKTAGESNSQTNDDIYITLHGIRDSQAVSCHEVLLTTNSDRSSEKMTYLGCENYMEQIEKVTVRLDGSDGWYMEEMIIYDELNNLYFKVQCEVCWFDGGPAPDPRGEPTRTMDTLAYKAIDVTAVTTDIRDGHTDNPLYITLMGSNYPQQTCDEALLTTNDGPELTKTTKLLCPATIGSIERVVVRLEGTDGWHMDSLLVSDMFLREAYHVPCDCWFDDGHNAAAASEPSRNLEAFLQPNEGLFMVTSRPTFVAGNLPQLRSDLTYLRWKI